MNRTLTVFGVILVAIGALWLLQGLGYVGGSFMTGQQRWTVIGAVTAVIGGLVLLWGSLRRR